MKRHVFTYVTDCHMPRCLPRIGTFALPIMGQIRAENHKARLVDPNAITKRIRKTT